MPETYDTAMDLLQASADTLEASAAACEQSADADDLLALAGRIRRYLATSRALWCGRSPAGHRHRS